MESLNGRLVRIFASVSIETTSGGTSASVITPGEKRGFAPFHSVKLKGRHASSASNPQPLEPTLNQIRYWSFSIGVFLVQISSYPYQNPWACSFDLR